MGEKRKVRERKYSRHWLILANLPDGIAGSRADQIARMAQCSLRTVYRDLDQLIAAGFPVEKEKTSRGTVWRLAKGFRSFPPMPFTLVDAAALEVAERRLRAAGDTYFAELVEEMLSKLRHGRGAELAKVLARLETSFVGMGGKISEEAVLQGPRPEWFGLLGEAIRERRKVKGDYRDEHGKLLRGKKLFPLSLGSTSEGAFFTAALPGGSEVRVFDLADFRKLELTRERFTSEWENTGAAGVAENPFGYRSRVEEVELELEPEAERRLFLNPLHPSQSLSRKSGCTVCRLRVRLEESLLQRLLALGGAARVVRPRRLGRILADRHRTAAAQVQQSVPESPACEPVLPLSFE